MSQATGTDDAPWQAPRADDAVVDRTRTAPRRPAGPGRPRRTHDYRLRGLDLDAPVATSATSAQPSRRPVHPSVRRRRRRRVVQWVVALVAGAAVAGAMRTWVVQPYKVTTTSMLPTLQVGTDVLVVRPSALTGSIDPGDIVVLRSPEAACLPAGGADELVKRVVAVSGQTIWSEGERIFVDGELLDRPTWHNPPFGEVGPTPIPRTTVPEGSYYLLGDNRTDTCDSRAFGPVPGALVIGEAVATTARDGHVQIRLL